MAHSGTLQAICQFRLTEQMLLTMGLNERKVSTIAEQRDAQSRNGART
jgi:hypothetical protein